MPTRYLKPGICDSEIIDRCSPLAECLFYRLLVNVDDFGRLDARPAVIRSKCFPLKDSIANKDVKNLLNEIHTIGLIVLYKSNGADFLQISKWDNVPRSQTSKCPTPPAGSHPSELLEIISENDLEDAICLYIDKSREFAGLQVHSWSRQVRHGESYFDMVLETNIGQVGIELKRSRLSKKAIDQSIKYATISNIPFLLIGSGLGIGVDISDCESSNVCVVTYNQDFMASVIGGRIFVTQRDFTLKQVSALTGTGTVTKTGTVKPKHKPEPETGVNTIEIPDWIPTETWLEFVESRKANKKPLTHGAIKLAIITLKSLKESGNDPRLVLEQSILSGWSGLFKLNGKQQSVSDQNRSAIEEWKAGQRGEIYEQV